MPLVDHFHELTELRQASGVNQALVRVGGGDRFIMHMATLNSYHAVNDSCRFLGIWNSAVVHSKIKGGIYNIGVDPSALDDFPSNLIDHWVWNVKFDYGQELVQCDPPQFPQCPYPAAINIRKRVHKVILDNVRVTGGGRFADFDGAALGDPNPIVEIRNCTYNGNPVTLLHLGDLNGAIVTITP